jgi:hypothetical protein
MKKALSLTVLSSLLTPTRTIDPKVFATYKRMKEQSQRRRYPNKYLDKAYSAWNADPMAHRSVQSLKSGLKNYPHVQRMNHPYHFGMPLENKQAYTAKREETLRRLSEAKMHRASQKLKTKLTPGKRSRLEKRMSRKFL